MRAALAGTATRHCSSCAAPAARVTVRGSKLSASPAPPSLRPASVARTVIARAVVLRSVKPASKSSPWRASNCRSCVTRTLALPLPKRSAPAAATATSRKLVSESFSGTSICAWPLASSTTLPRHSSSVSKSSRVGLRPPPPPGGSALRP